MAQPIVVVGHFPPPVNGMAVAVEEFANRLERIAPVRRLATTSGTATRSTPTHLLRRLARVLRAWVLIVWFRRGSTQLYASCDAGLGMVFTMTILAVARVCSYRITVHHHSYAYVARRSLAMATLVRVAGPRANHVVACSTMRRDFRARYPRAPVDVVSVAYVLAPARGRASRSDSPIRVGHLGNLSRDKGLLEVFAVAAALSKRGVPIRLAIGGPAASRRDQQLLDQELRRCGVPVEYAGPLSPQHRTQFLRSIDVFLFPSRYRHESFGLVAWEAMAQGVTVLTNRAGCLDAAAVGDAGIVVDDPERFVDVAVEMVEHWDRDRNALQRAGEAAVGVSERARVAANAQLEEYCGRLAG